MKTGRMTAIMMMTSLVVGSHGALLTQTINYGPETPNFDGSASFNQYSGSGILTQVVVRATLTADNYNIIADNEGTATGSLTAYVGARNFTYLSAMDETRTLVATNKFSFTLSADDGDGFGVQTNGTDWAQFSANGLLATWTKTYTADLAGFMGVGTFNWTYQVESYYNVGGSPALLVTPGTSGGLLEVSYYTMIPEPATVSIIAGSGIVLFIRRRRIYRLPV